MIFELSYCILHPINEFKLTKYVSAFVFFDFSVPVKSVEAVIGGKAELPCDIYPSDTVDDVYLVLWYRDIAGKPLYR